MIVPKELAEKADCYETLKNETEKLFEELEAWAKLPKPYEPRVKKFN